MAYRRLSSCMGQGIMDAPRSLRRGTRLRAMAVYTTCRLRGDDPGQGRRPLARASGLQGRPNSLALTPQLLPLCSSKEPPPCQRKLLARFTTSEKGPPPTPPNGPRMKGVRYRTDGYKPRAKIPTDYSTYKLTKPKSPLRQRRGATRGGHQRQGREAIREL